MSKETLKANLREIPDFPIPGILFYDVTTLFKNPECLQEILDTLYEMYKDKGITKVVGIESRGFIMGGALAARLGAGFVMARKPGKLPAEVVEETYAKEYGTDTIQIHKDAIDENRGRTAAGCRDLQKAWDRRPCCYRWRRILRRCSEACEPWNQYHWPAGNY